MTQNVSVIQSRLPFPQGVNGLDAGKWRVLCESVFPSAKSTDAILMALDYCRVRNLDIFKKPVNIVPMWSSQKGGYVETVWEGINSIQVTASRTQSWAGMDEPKWGKDITHTFKGFLKNNVGETEVTITYPEYCSVTVYRIVHGERYAFTETVYWLEAYARIGKGELPNDMWAKRPKGQLHKCAKAASLRSAFPEESTYTSDEMEGRILEEVDGVTVVIDEKVLTAKQAYGSATAMKAKWKEISACLTSAETENDLTKVFEKYKADFTTIKSIDSQLYDSLVAIGTQRRSALDQEEVESEVAPEGSEEDIARLKGFNQTGEKS